MTFSYKIRRKWNLQFLVLIIIIFLRQTALSAKIVSQCPEYCECHLNENGLQSAICSENTWNVSNKITYPNIHVLELKSNDSEAECYIPSGEISISKLFTQLNFLYLQNCSLGYFSPYIFQQFKSLQEIDLSNNNFKKFSPSLFASNHLLRYVSLKNNPLIIMPRPFLISKSIWELDLSSCGITDIPHAMFQNLTNLKYLTLFDNKLKTVYENVLPTGLKTLNLAKNFIKNVPIPELVRLKQLKEIDLTKNPINCTCELIGFQNYLSGKGLIFLNVILCEYPTKFKGTRLLNVPQYEICQVPITSESSSTETCEDGQVCSNHIIPADEGYQADEGESNPIEQEGLILYDGNHSPVLENKEFEGSGDVEESDGTDIPIKNISRGINNSKENVTENFTENFISSSSMSTEPKHNSQKSSEIIESGSENKTENVLLTYSEDKNESSVNTEHSLLPEIGIEKHTSEISTIYLPSKQNNSKNVEISTTDIHSSEMYTDYSLEHAYETTIDHSYENSLETSTAKDKTSENNENIPLSTSEKSVDEIITSSLDITTKTAFITNNEEKNFISKDPSIETTIETVKNTSDITLSTSEEITILPPSNQNMTDKTLDDNNSAFKSDEITTTFIPQVTASLQSNLNIDSMFNSINLSYLIAVITVALVIILCLIVYVMDQRNKSSKKNWKPSDINPTNDGTEMQEISLLPQIPKSAIVKYNNKYLLEETSEQTVGLISNTEEQNHKSVWQHLEEPIENGTSMNGKLPNGNGCQLSIDIIPQPIECTIAKVTNLPDSIPKTPVIIHSNS